MEQGGVNKCMNEIVDGCLGRREREWRLEVSGKKNGGERASGKYICTKPT